LSLSRRVLADKNCHGTVPIFTLCWERHGDA